MSRARDNAWIAILILGLLLAALQLSDLDSISYGAYYGAALLAIAAFVVATVVHGSRFRWPWYLLTSGIIMHAVADGLWDAGVALDGPEDVVAYATSFLYVGAVLVSILAFYQWDRRVFAGSEREDTIDAAIVTLSFAVISWMFIIAPRLDAPMFSPGSEILVVLYALLDLFPLALLVRMGLRHGLRRYRPIGLFIIGAMALAIADSLFGWGELTGNAAAYETVADSGWLIWYIAWAAAALDPTNNLMQRTSATLPDAGNPASGRRLTVVTAVAFIGPLSLVLVAPASRPLDTAVVGVASIILFGLVIYRMALIISSLELALGTQERLQEELSHAAFHDALTGLVNRAFLHTHLDALLQAREHPDVAVLFIDLDNFKDINDRFGHAGGDKLLVELGRRLTASTRESDVVSRHGGDEFLIVIDLNEREPQWATTRTAERILAALSRPVILNGEPVVVSASIGIAWPGANRMTVDSIFGAADRAMYEAKRTGKNRYSVAETGSQGVRESGRPEDVGDEGIAWDEPRASA